jgi:hypothetical protein
MGAGVFFLAARIVVDEGVIERLHHRIVTSLLEEREGVSGLFLIRLEVDGSEAAGVVLFELGGRDVSQRLV